VEVLSTRLNRLPSWLRIVATTRRDPDVLARLKDLKAAALETQDPRNLMDVRQYVTAALNWPEIRPQVEASGRQADAVAESFLTSSAGNFLVVSTTLRAVRGRQLTLEQAETLPPELDVRYRMFFDRMFKDAGVDYKPSRGLLEVVLAAKEPLRRSELAALTGLDEDYELGELLDRLAAFVPVREGRHALFHKSLADWLTGKDTTSGQPKAGPYYVKSENGRVRLADWCLGEFERGVPKASLYMRIPMKAYTHSDSCRTAVR
jgi:hypothetical protein